MIKTIIKINYLCHVTVYVYTHLHVAYGTFDKDIFRRYLADGKTMYIAYM